MADLTRATEKGPIRGLVLFLQGLSAFTLLSLMMITVIDVVGRYVFNRPLTGSTELTEIAVGLVVFSVFPIITWRNEQVVVDILDGFVPPRLDFMRNLLFNLIVSGSLLFLGQRIWVLGQRSLSYEEMTEYLGIPSGWMMLFIAVSCWLAAAMTISLGNYRAWRAWRRQRSRRDFC
jgi:TRAP-type C4-dicarboxylate transport system permease small subunit